jgi:outer membrane protein assembly factor BamD (BamD/ComL family)
MRIKCVFLLLLSCFNLFLSCTAQDANLEAKVLYTKAEEAFNSGNYTESLKQLDNVENTLGATNSRILYLKANCYNNLLKTDWRYADKLSATLNQFFSMT